MPARTPPLLIDLSHIAEEHRDAVGAALSRQAVTALGRRGLLTGRYLMGRLRPDIYGVIAPEDLRGLDANHLAGIDAALGRIR